MSITILDNPEVYRILDILRSGRGRHAPMAMRRSDGGVDLYRDGRRDTAFSDCLARQLVTAGLLRLVENGSRYVITPAGRKRAEADR
jgi:hypothetical protein